MKPGDDAPLSRVAKPTSRPTPGRAATDRHIAEQRVDGHQARPDTEPHPTSRPEPAGKTAKSAEAKPAKSAGGAVPGARLSNYAEEAAELLAGLSSSRKRRKAAAGEPAGDQVPQESPIAASNLPGKGQTKSSAKK